jgi:hypothetical protein
VANGAAFGALLLLHALTRLELGEGGAARRAVLFAALFPTSFFLLAPYSESLFLLLAVAAFWSARRDRWGWAAAAGAGAALTRGVGFAVALGLLVEAIRAWRSQGRPPLPRVGAAVVAGAAPLLYLGWWWIREGEPGAPLEAQTRWARTVTFPLATAWDALEHAWRYGAWWLMDVAVVTLAVVGLVLIARRVVLAYSVFAWAGLLLPLGMPFPDRPLLSMPRFVLVLFPAYWGLARLTGRRPGAETALVAGSAAAAGILAALFVNWQPVF